MVPEGGRGRQGEGAPEVRLLGQSEDEVGVVSGPSGCDNLSKMSGPKFDVD